MPDKAIRVEEIVSAINFDSSECSRSERVGSVKRAAKAGLYIDVAGQMLS